MRRLWHDYSLGIIYIVGFFVAVALHAYGEWWSSQYVPMESIPWLLNWWTSFWENIQSEMFQIGLFIILSKHFLYRGSPQSKGDS